MAIYVKNFKNIFSRINRPMTLESNTRDYYQDCSNDDRGLTLTFLWKCQIAENFKHLFKSHWAYCNKISYRASLG